MISTILLFALLLTLTLGTHPARAGVIFVNPGDAGTTAGHPAKPWTEAEKAIVNEALSEWKTFIENFDQVLGTWTLRWEDADLFKRFGEVGAPNDLLDIPGVTVPRGGWAAGQYPSPPKNSPDFPEGEIYFNTLLQWFLDPTPATDDAGEPPRANDRLRHRRETRDRSCARHRRTPAGRWRRSDGENDQPR